MTVSMNDCSQLELQNERQVEAILHLYRDLPVAKDNILSFINHLLERKDSWFLQVSDVGLIYLTNVIPHFSAQFNFIFWDGRLSRDRREVMREVCENVEKLFDLHRLQVLCPAANIPYVNTVRKIGFMQEGVFRKAWMEENKIQDLVVLARVREDKEWQPTAVVMTTSDSAT